MKLYIPTFFFSFLFELAFLDDQITSPICTYFFCYLFLSFTFPFLRRSGGGGEIDGFDTW
jgi:hypothetical protein